MVTRNPERWRSITPWVTITNLFVSVCVAIIGFFLVRTLDSLQKSIDMHTAKIDGIIMDVNNEKISNVQRYAEIKYQCCRDSAKNF